MKNKMKKIVVMLFVVISLAILAGCANMHWGANAGVNVNWGPNGPRVHPHVGVNLYSGGKVK